jgi:integrase
MALKKRGKTWHTHFFVDGIRYRQSLETSDYREALKNEKTQIALAKAGKLAASRNVITKLPFAEAAQQFLADREPHLAALSVRTEKERATAINRVLGQIPVSRITPVILQNYIRQRKASGIANATVNRELDIIRGVLKKAKRWHMFADEIKPLPLRQKIGRALSYDEKLRLLKVSASRPEWQTASWAAVLALNTTMRGCEIKGLRWRDVDFLENTLTIRKSKTEAGERVIPLNADALRVVLALYARARVLNGTQPDHYVFPACESGHIDPTRPQASWRTAWRNAWRNLTRAINCLSCGLLQAPADTCANDDCKADISKVKSPLAGLRFHDLRHHAITELAESQASDSTVMSIAGHVSSKMLAHYSHVRIQAKRTALDALATGRRDTWAEGQDSGSKVGGYDTNNDTKEGWQDEQIPQVIENMVELVGIEPTTSSLRTMRSPS